MESKESLPNRGESGAPEKRQGSPSGTVRGMYFLFAGNTTCTLLLAVTAIVVGRILGPALYGLYTIALILPPFVFLFARLGLGTAATRYPARYRSEGREREAVSFAYAATVAEMAISLVVTLVFVFISASVSSGVLNHPELGSVILPLAMLSVVGQSAYLMGTSDFTGLERYGTVAWFSVVQGAVKLVASVGLVLLGFSVAGAVAGYTASYLVSGLLGVALILKLNGRLIPSGFRRDISEAMRFGMPVFGSALASGIIVPLLNTVLARTVSTVQIGGYTAANTFSALIVLFTYPISTVLFPLFSKRYDDRRQLGGLYETTTRFTALFVLPVTAFIMAFSSPLIETFYGHAYSFGAGYLTLLTSMSLLAGLGSLAWGNFLAGVGSVKDYFTATITGTVVAVGSGGILILSIGVYGAILGQLVGQVVSLGVATWLIRRYLGVTPRLRSLWKVYLAAAAAGVLCYPLSLAIRTPELATFVGALAYIVLFVPFLALLKTLSQEDIESLRGYFGLTPLLSRLLEFALRYYGIVASVLP